MDPPSRRKRSVITGNAFQSSKTHCPRGHEYTPGNTKLAKSTKPGRFKRQCRTCKSERSKRPRVDKPLASNAAQQAPDLASAAQPSVNPPANPAPAHPHVPPPILALLTADLAQLATALAQFAAALADATGMAATEAHSVTGAEAVTAPGGHRGTSARPSTKSCTAAPTADHAQPESMIDAPNAPRPFQQLALRFLEYTGRQRPLQAKASPVPRLPNRARKSSKSDSARKNNTSGYEGVSWNWGRNKWVAYVTSGSKRHYVGLFDDPADAARAIEQARAQPKTYFENRRLLRARRSGRRRQQSRQPAFTAAAIGAGHCRI
ncbi:AP2 domain-containing protein [Bradyrhizobium sp. NAS80.1]|uniref:AP2 domain-containing protein n=1 Tax=Bradyrhizobium sp. NAS80.1 TaxID=1680159 RepID=UPI0011615458|nr:AP2 domain-containing protein [Bradyrhizobium sp. NAS80.1]